MLLRQLETGLNCPDTTSMGRWFDAIAGLAGICPEQSFESEAAQKLEAWLRLRATGRWLAGVCGQSAGPQPAGTPAAATADPVAIASLWHATLAHALADWASGRQHHRHAPAGTGRWLLRQPPAAATAAAAAA
jgi:hydrogenase maturation protein HypF